MGLDISKLEHVTRTRTKIIARCPACAEMGRDKKGEHLFIAADGRFGCVVNPGYCGGVHRKRIFELVGVLEKKYRGFQIRKKIDI